MMRKTTITVTPELRKRLQLLAVQHELTYEKLLEDLLYTYQAEQPFRSETEFADWFELNFQSFGFEKILQKNKYTSPDYVMEDMHGKIVNVELELLDRSFRTHKDQMDEIDFDYIVCAYGTKSEILGVPVLSLKQSSPWKAKLILDVPHELWEEFKTCVTRDKTMNDAVTTLIRKRVDRYKAEDWI